MYGILFRRMNIFIYRFIFRDMGDMGGDMGDMGGDMGDFECYVGYFECYIVYLKGRMSSPC